MVRANVQNQLSSLWLSLPNYGDSGKEEWLNTAPALVATGQEVIAELTDLYTSSILENLLGRPVPETGHVPTEYRRADPQEVYSRMFKTVYYELSQGKDIEDAARIGQTRAAVTSGTDLWLAHTVTAHEVLSLHSSRGLPVTGHRRVPSGISACDLCEGDEYPVSTRLPIHNRCSCGSMPLVGEAKVTRSNDKVTIEHHGEIGPMLAKKLPLMAALS